MTQAAPRKAKLTTRLVGSIPPAAQDVLVWDTKVQGFYVKVAPSGRRTFNLFYRTRSGQQRRLHLGVFGSVKVEQARKHAERARAAIAEGRDPFKERQDYRRAATVAALCDLYIKEVIEAAAPQIRPTTAREYRRLIEKRIRPEFGARKVADIKPADVHEFHQRMASTPRQANQAAAVLSRLMALAVRKGWRSDNPCRGAVERFRENTRDRFLTDEEFGRLGAALNAAEREGTEPAGVIRAIKLLALTGRRLSDILGLRWDWVDFQSGKLRLPHTKTGPQDVVLGTGALALLKDAPRNGPWVVTGADPTKPLNIYAMERAWQRIRNAAGIQDVRLHDLRRTHGTYGAQAGANAFLVRDILGHAHIAMASRYVGRAENPVKALRNTIEERITRAMAGKSAEVVPLPARTSQAG